MSGVGVAADDRITRREALRRAALASAVAAFAPLLPAARALAAPVAIDRSLALFLARVCEQTYAQLEQNGRFTVPAGYTLVQAFRATAVGRAEWFGFVIESADRVVVAFRGSKTDPDWIADANIVQTTYPFVADAGRTHAGFTGIYGSCRDVVLGAVRSRARTKHLLVTGHSLGAALATLAALDVAVNSPFARPTLYNYASPRVGNPAFAAAYDRRVSPSVRIVNVHDIVPMMPGAGYVHVEAPYRIAFQTHSIAGNHALVNYIKALEA